MTTPAASFSIRNISCDYYFADAQFTTFHKLPADFSGRLPVLRIFGITSEGQKCCAHIHGCFPYVWIRTRLPLNSGKKEQLRETVTSIINQIPDLSKDPQGPVVEINDALCKSIYGYTDADEYFAKISLRDPRYIKFLAEYLQKQSLSNYMAQPFTAHVPYILQFFIDHDIFGMGLVHFDSEKIRFRRLPPNNVPSSSFQLGTHSPITKMSVEFDAPLDALRNSSFLSESPYVNTGLQVVYENERARRGLNATPLPVPSPSDGHDETFILPNEEKYLNELRTYCAQHASEDLDCTLREEATLRDVNVSIIDETFFESMTPSVSNVRVDRRRHSHLEGELEANEGDSPNWDKMEAETRGFEEGEDEDIDGNEELVSDSEEEGNDNVPDESNWKNFEQEEVFNHERIQPRHEGVCSIEIDPLQSDEGDDQEEEEEVIIRKRPRHYVLDSRYQATLTDSFFNSQPTGKSPAVNNCTALPTNSAVPHLCAMAVEVLALPKDPNDGIANPLRDPIIAVAVSVNTDVVNWNGRDFDFESVIVVADELPTSDQRILVVENEGQLLKALANVMDRFNPDVLIGYDLVRGSWAYICERALAINHFFVDLATRLESAAFPSFHTLLIGRIKLEVWRIIRRERPLRCYEFGYATTTILERRFSHILVHDLISLVCSKDPSGRRVAALHFLDMARCDLKILHTLDVFIRTSQMAQLYGIQYTEVINRGSQFRVESTLLRIAKKSAFLPPSVSVEQRNRMGAPETIPLNLEPASGIYYDPVAVLDFQSLYPSVCIAYNYCFSTCLGKMGRVCNAEGGMLMKLGALQYERLPLGTLKKLIEKDEVHVAPTGCAFVKPSVQKGLMGSMLKELLDARVMVKKSMKRYTGDQKTYRQLDAQQMALKLVANTTYGYAAANWSGRMPCEEVAEAIVSKGREALERAIEMIQTAPPELYDGARVIYGDTDSIFVLFEGCTRQRAFELGQQIAEEVTKMNPHPMKLKFEKIMQPCVLLTKKRYVGNSYENSPEEIPKFDAKGIETVRRDCCPFVSKLMEKSLRLLFEKGVDSVLQYLNVRLKALSQFPYSDFVINTEYRGHYADHAVVPGKKLAKEMTKRSERFAPQPGERLSYVIVRRRNTQEKKTRLISCVVSLEEFLVDPDLLLHWNYYVSRPLFSALSRVLNLVPVRLNWQTLHSNGCYSCHLPNSFPLCDRCVRDVRVYQRLLIEKAAVGRKQFEVTTACKECFMPEEHGNFDFTSCMNMRCEVAQKRLEVSRCLAPRLVDKHKSYVFEITLKD